MDDPRRQHRLARDQEVEGPVQPGPLVHDPCPNSYTGVTRTIAQRLMEETLRQQVWAPTPLASPFYIQTEIDRLSGLIK